MTQTANKPVGTIKPTIIGILAIGIGIFGFGIWAVVAPLEGAVIAKGTVLAAGRNKPIQHLTGGTIKSILVAEGEHVSAGEVLMLLDPTEAEVNRNRIRSRIDQIDALRARWTAEKLVAREVKFSASLKKKAENDRVILKLIEDQREEFDARNVRFVSELRILQRKKEVLKEEIQGLAAQKESVSIQLELVQQEIVDALTLLQRKLIKKSKTLELQRTQAALFGQEGKLLADISKAKQSILETEMQTQRLHAKRIEEASTQLSQLHSTLADLQEQLRSAEEALSRAKILAPADGIVMNLGKTGNGAIVEQGEVLMEIVPVGNGMTIETQVRPQDIDHVWVGQPVRLVFPALGGHSVAPAKGRVVKVSPDLVSDVPTGEPYYSAHLILDEHYSQTENSGVTFGISPGQPVEAFFTTGERSLTYYLLEPIIGTVRRSLRENY